MTREKAISNLLDKIGNDLIISSNGKISRELYELRLKRKEKPNDFYMLGSMGCAVGIGLGVTMNTKKKVYVLTGDGAFLMKLGSLATVLRQFPRNLEIIILNNNAHDSCGGQPTAFRELEHFIRKYCKVINVEKGARKDLGRVKLRPIEIVKNFREKIYS